jgi:hypothetical protein
VGLLMKNFINLTFLQVSNWESISRDLQAACKGIYCQHNNNYLCREKKEKERKKVNLNYFLAWFQSSALTGISALTDCWIAAIFLESFVGQSCNWVAFDISSWWHMKWLHWLLCDTDPISVFSLILPHFLHWVLTIHCYEHLV